MRIFSVRPLTWSCTIAAVLGFNSFFPTQTRAENSEAVLTLSALDGSSYAPLDVKGKKAVVLFFISPYCPTSNTLIPEINKIIADYDATVTSYLVHSDKDVKQTDALQHTEMMQIKVPVLMDTERVLAKKMEAKITPEVVVLGAEGKVLYKGRINDLYLGPTKKQRKATTKDLRDALDAIGTGKPVALPVTEAIGCKISGLE